MISDLVWPPSQETGRKQIVRQLVSGQPYMFSLEGLHDPAWWTGLKIACAEAPDTQVHVALRRRNGSPAFDVADDQCKWLQTCGSWCHFAWPIPAAMATEMDLYLELTYMAEEGAVAFFSIAASFHEMTGLDPREKYLFIDGEGVPVHHWNGCQHVWGNPVAGLAPEWGAVHTVIPMIAQVLAVQDWNDNRMFSIRDWQEIVPPG